MKHKHIYTPYCYYLSWSKLNKHYYGVRYARKDRCLYDSGCHPDDLLVTYMTSSKNVHKLLEEYGDPDVKQIRKTFTSAEDAARWEKKFISRSGIIYMDHWLNLTDSKAIMQTAEVKRKISRAKKGRKMSEEVRRRMSDGHKGLKESKETKMKKSLAHKGRPKSEAHKQAMKNAVRAPRVTIECSICGRVMNTQGLWQHRRGKHCLLS